MEGLWYICSSKKCRTQLSSSFPYVIPDLKHDGYRGRVSSMLAHAVVRGGSGAHLFVIMGDEVPDDP
jgi:hypothetical protein